MNRLFALVPVKDPAEGKSRLASLLRAGQRYALNLALARHTMQTCVACVGAERTVVVTASDSVRALATALGVRIADEGIRSRGLNTALSAGVSFAQQCGAQGLIIVPTDLPLLSAPLLAAAIDAMPAAPGCLLVPDRRGRGTNLMGMTPATVELLAFGGRSLDRHARRARELGYAVQSHACARVALDLDFPEDYRQLEKLSAVPPLRAPAAAQSKLRAAAGRRGRAAPALAR